MQHFFEKNRVVQVLMQIYIGCKLINNLGLFCKYNSGFLISKMHTGTFQAIFKFNVSKKIFSYIATNVAAVLNLDLIEQLKQKRATLLQSDLKNASDI